ncbi:MAG: 50S ribosomal protein L15 [Planctomycetota bacterium]
MNLLDIRRQIRPHRRKTRVGRGIGSGLGKTAGRGHKGQKSRSGYTMRSSFEGGQMPMARRVPKRGFRNTAFQDDVEIVNLRDLSGFAPNEVVDLAALKSKGIVPRYAEGIRILSEGDLDRPLVIRVSHVSASARKKIEAAGGKAETVPIRKKFVKAKKNPRAAVAKGASSKLKGK